MTVPRLPINQIPHLRLFLDPSSSQMHEMGDTVEEWKDALKNYDLALRTIRPNGAQNRDILRRLDTNMYSHLPIMISSRSPHYITASEYAIIVEWKLRRGIWRQQTLHFARTATDDEVRKASAKAFKQLEQGKIGEAFDTLVPLPGGSPSIASGILSARDSSVPFMSRELLRASQGNNINYFRSALLEVVENVKAKARYLSRRDLTKTWSSVDVEKAIYAQAHIPKPSHVNFPDANVPSANNPQANVEAVEERTNSGNGGRSPGNDLAPSSEAGNEDTDQGIGEEEPFSRYSRPKNRMNVKQMTRTNGKVEVLVGPIDMEDVEELDELEDGSGGSLYVPKSDPTDVDEDSDDGRMNEELQAGRSQAAIGRTTYQRHR